MDSHFVTPLMKKNVIFRLLKFAGFIHHYNLVWEYFWLNFEKQDGRHECFF